VTASDGALDVVATTGSTTTRPPQFGFGSERSTAEIVLRPGTDTLPGAMPVLASDAFLDAAEVSVGDELPLALSAGTRRVVIVGSFHRFPTLAPETPAVIADLESYLAGAFAADRSVVQPSAWWLAAPDDRRVAERLRAAPFRSITMVSRTAEERAALDDPVAVGVIGALALGFVVAAIFAVAGFAANAVAEARSRRLELAVLRSLGLRRTELTRLVGLETALVVVASLVGGALLGLLVSRLVLPDVGLGASGATPVPPVRLVVPWTSVLLLEIALLAALAAVGAVQVEVVRRLRLATALRAGEGAAAP
jgi:predicted lysophospholipase L1 biosynthesis ABC-type transport system permease subunit